MKKLLLALLLTILPHAALLLCAQPADADADFIFGNTSTAGASYTALSGTRYAMRHTCPQNGTVRYLSIQCQSILSTTYAAMAIYADSGSNTPGALLGQTNTYTAVASGLNQIPMLTPVSVSSSVKYWLGFLSADANGIYYYRSASDSYQVAKTTGATYPQFPDPFSSYSWGSNQVLISADGDLGDTPTNTATTTQTPYLSPTQTPTESPVLSPTMTPTATPTSTATATATPVPMVHYIATNGSDSTGDGSIGSPWLTLTYASAHIPAGSTLYMRGGTYSEHVTIADCSGSAGVGYTTISGYPGETAIIDGTGITVATGDALFRCIGNRSWICFKNFIIQNTQPLGGNHPMAFIAGQGVGSHIKWDGITWRWNYCGGYSLRIYCDDAGQNYTDLQVTNCTAYGNSVIALAQECIHASGNIQRISYDHNKIGWCDNIGLDMVNWTPYPFTDGYIGYNSVTHCGSNAWASGIYVDGAAKVVVEHNTIDSCDVGISLSAEHHGNTATANIARYNLITNCNQFGVNYGSAGTAHGRIEKSAFYNNTIANGIVNYVDLLLFGYYLADNYFRNNILSTPNASTQTYMVYGRDNGVTVTAQTMDFDYTCWYPNGTADWWYVQSNYYNTFSAWQSTFSPIDAHSFSADPKLASDYSLSAGSPCIDAGDYLAYTVGSGSGTTITVNTARPFTAGITGYLAGDTVYLSRTSSAQVVSVDYDAKQLMLDRTMSWSNNQGVSLAYNGFRPDIGYAERTGTTYYVAKTGSDLTGDGSYAHPWLTIQHGISNGLVPGDVLAVETGTYNEKLLIDGAVGTSLNAITLTSYGADAVTIDGTGIDISSQDTLIQIQNCSYFTFHGITVQNGYVGDSMSNLLKTGSTNDHITVEYSKFQGNNGGCAVVFGYHALNQWITFDHNEVCGNSTAAYEAVRFNLNTHHFKATNNIFHDNSNIGIDICARWEGGVLYQPSEGYLAGNIVYRNGLNGWGYGWAAGIYNDGGKNIVIENNVSHDNYVGISSGAEGQGVTNTATIIRHCFTYNNYSDALMLGSQAGDGRIDQQSVYHLTCSGDGQGMQSSMVNLGYYVQGGSGSIIRNCLFNNPPYTAIYGHDKSVVISNAAFSFDRNCWYDMTWKTQVYAQGVLYTAAQWQSTFSEDPTSIFGNPLLDANTAITWSSPCKDAGAPIAYTVGAGSGTTMTVTNAWSFTDGYSGLFSGDTIYLNLTTSATVVSVDIPDNQLILSQSLSWSNNSGVYLTYTGTAPDIGYQEYSPTYLMGVSQTSGSSSSYVSTGATYGVKFTPQKSGSARMMEIFDSSAASSWHALLGVYADSGSNTPGALLAKSNTTTANSGGWTKFTLLTPASLIAGVQYWLSFVFDTDGYAYQSRVSDPSSSVLSYTGYSISNPWWGYNGTTNTSYAIFAEGDIYTSTSTITPTYTISPTTTVTPTVTPTPTYTVTMTPTITPTYTISPTYTITPTVTPTPTITKTSTITPTATDIPTRTPSQGKKKNYPSMDAWGW